MSQHVVVGDGEKWVFGWDQPLMSFYLEHHKLHLPEDEQIVAWLGATKDTIMYEVSDLVHAAAKTGLQIDHSMRVQLYGEKDDGV
jgi:DNA polymerase III psi subunit